MRKKSAGLLVGFLGVMAVVSGCSQAVPPPVELWVGSDRFGAPAPRGEDSLELYDRDKQTVYLYGAIGEVVGFKLSVGAEGVADVQIKPFIGEDGRRIADNVDLFRIHFVEAECWPGWHVKRIEPQRRQRRVPDVLVPVDAPRGGLPAEVAKDRVLDLWADVRVPRGAIPGTYDGEIEIIVDGQVARTLMLRLTVWPFVLPTDSGAEMVVDVDHRSLFEHHVVVDGVRHAPVRILGSDVASDELEAVLGSTMRLLKRHGLSPHLPWLYPVVKIDAEANLSVDWSDYDRVVSGFIDGQSYADRRAARSWQMPLDEGFPAPPSYGAMQSPTYSRMLSEYVKSAAEYAIGRGFFDRCFVRIPMASRWNARSCAATHHFGYLIHRAAPGLHTLSGLFPQDVSGAGWYGFVRQELRDDVDIWAPLAQFFDRGAIVRDFGAGIRMSVDRPPFSGSVSVVSPAVDTRVLALQGMQAGAEAVHLGTANPWPAAPGPKEHTSPQECVDHAPNVLIYPGGSFGLTEPVPSMRLKRLRRGIQDVAYLKLLESRGKGHIAQTLSRSLVARFGSDACGAYLADGRSGGWIDEPMWWEMARWIAIDELSKSPSDQELMGNDSVPAVLRWRRFMEATHGVDMGVTGVRIRLADNRPGAGVDIECRVQVTNRQRTPLAGAVRFDTLPLGWRGAPGTRRLRRLAPGETGRVILGARTDSLAWGDHGVLYLPVVFDGDDGKTRRCVARMCHVTAQRLDNGITLDGDLGDWPVAMGNGAGDFVLLTGEGQAAGSDVPAARPTRDTLCYVGVTRDKLVFALRCPYGANQPDQSVRSSAIAPDDLVMMGEDTVEILLDPSNAGTRSPADLYRIVVRGGGAVWERGVTMTPPAGQAGPWAAEIRHVVRTFADHWTAEVAIPLEAFPEAYRTHAVWGLNLVRFDAAACESSNWAGAVGNVYDPLTLGNMTLP